jgi:opacity protein-like surface antigen
MKTLVAAAILAMAIASPALAQRAQSAPQQGHQSEQRGYYRGYPLQEWYRDDSW